MLCYAKQDSAPDVVTRRNEAFPGIDKNGGLCGSSTATMVDISLHHGLPHIKVKGDGKYCLASDAKRVISKRPKTLTRG